ncbi:MAG: cell wall-binding repeat-containing protein [Firmicutes bacterium]|nr:cell wall-binding repeat-containing protein [Bacillota bacterium]
MRKNAKRAARRASLDAAQKNVYDAMLAQIERVAAGEEASAYVSIPITEVTEQRLFTKEELGVAAANTDEATNALYEYLIDVPVQALLFDKPYDLYWFDKVNGYLRKISPFYRTSARIRLDDTSRIEVWLFVAKAYSQSGEEETSDADVGKTAAASGAVAAAKQVAADAAVSDALIYQGDYGRLAYFRDAILNAVSYDWSANAYTQGYGDPWQLIYVFDGDPTTNVVCEGYSKAFKFLCDLSTFESDVVEARIMTGYLDGDGHMWNVVRLDDAKNYLVDLTNCDNGMMGAPDLLFVKEAPDGDGTGYAIPVKSSVFHYTYDGDEAGSENALRYYTETERTLAKTPYVTGHVHQHADYVWTGLGDGQEPTCTEEGWAETMLCSGCGEVVQEHEQLAALGHAAGDWETVKPATCTEEGNRRQLCSRCGETLEEETIAATGHSWDGGAVTRAATYEDVGVRTYTCTVCGATRGETIPRLEKTDLGAAKTKTAVRVGNVTYNGKAQTPEVKVTALVGGKTLTLTAGTDYTLRYQNNVAAGRATVTVSGKGAYSGQVEAGFSLLPADIGAAKVSGLKTLTYTGSALKPEPKLTLVLAGKTVTLARDTDYLVFYRNNLEPGAATVVIRGIGNFNGSLEKTFAIILPPATYVRMAGADRYQTACAIATEYRKALGGGKLRAVCVADGLNYPDALAGACFASAKQAPILVIHSAAPASSKTQGVLTFIRKNLQAGGTVYLLGGPASVPDTIGKTLEKAGFKVQRLWGANRYLSNLAMLKAAKIKAGQEFIVTTGTDYRDALTASATGKPVLLVRGNSLTPEQAAYLKAVKAKRFVILGTRTEVSAGIEKELKTYAPVKRLAGKAAYERSVQAAQEFFGTTVSHINLADERNFPDALCGGPLAVLRGGPLLLTDGSRTVNNKLRAYADQVRASKATLYGGPASVAEATVKYVLRIN